MPRTRRGTESRCLHSSIATARRDAERASPHAFTTRGADASASTVVRGRARLSPDRSQLSSVLYTRCANRKAQRPHGREHPTHRLPPRRSHRGHGGHGCPSGHRAVAGFGETRICLEPWMPPIAIVVCLAQTQPSRSRPGGTGAAQITAGSDTVHADQIHAVRRRASGSCCAIRPHSSPSLDRYPINLSATDRRMPRGEPVPASPNLPGDLTRLPGNAIFQLQPAKQPALCETTLRVVNHRPTVCQRGTTPRTR